MPRSVGQPAEPKRTGEAEVAALTRDLLSKKAGFRLAAARKLGKLGRSARDALGPLARATAADDDEIVRRAAATAFWAVLKEVAPSLRQPEAPRKKAGEPVAPEPEDLLTVGEAAKLQAEVAAQMRYLGSGDSRVRYTAATRLGKKTPRGRLELGRSAVGALGLLAEVAQRDADEDVREAARRAFWDILKDVAPSLRQPPPKTELSDKEASPAPVGPAVSKRAPGTKAPTPERERPA